MAILLSVLGYGILVSIAKEVKTREHDLIKMWYM